MNIVESIPYRERKSASLWKHRELLFALFGGVFLLLAYVLPSPSLTLLLYILSYTVGGFYKAKEGITDLLEERSFNVEILMILAALGAASIGFWSEGAILIFIFAVSGALETYTLQKSEKDLSNLAALAPMEALLLSENGESMLVPVERLRLGDLILVRGGDRIPADGVVHQGFSAVDEATITGEAVPVEKKNGDTVYNGTMNGNGTLQVEVRKENKDSLFQKMIQLVEQAKTSRPPSQKLIERIEGPYVIVVLSTVAMMMLVPPVFFNAPVQETFYRAMILLVVASPCAVVASVMPALLSGVSTSARNGLLMKGGVPLEQLIKMKVVALDKTGTLTQGKPAVTDIHLEKDAENKQRLLAIAAGIEAQSSHPLAKAIVEYAEEYTDVKAKVTSMQNKPGLGIEARVDENLWLIGNEKLMQQQAWSREAEAVQREWKLTGHTVIYITKNNIPQAIIALKDSIRPEAAALIAELKRRDILPVMITGDNEDTARAIAKETGLDHWISSCLPEQKMKEIERLRDEYGSIAMVGDGVNDAPAMAKANIGIAMGSGTDVAIDAADMVLMKSELSKIRLAFRLSGRLQKVIMQNLIFSAAVILTLIAANFAQQITLPLGVIGHEGSTILVILNGLRLLKT